MSRSVVLIECHELYNYLQNKDAHALHRMQNYILLLDCRERREYDESHIVTAQHINVENTSAVITTPFGADMGCRDHVVVYDSATTGLDDVSRAVVCAQSIAADSSRNPIKILKGGYEAFTAYYPFLRSKKVFHMPSEYTSIKLYPIEVLSPLFLYLGDEQQGSDDVLHKDLHIRALIKCFEDVKPGESRMSRRSVVSYVSQSENLDPNAKPAEYCFELPDDEDVPDIGPHDDLSAGTGSDTQVDATTGNSNENSQVRFINDGLSLDKSGTTEKPVEVVPVREQLIQAVRIIETYERQKDAVLVFSKRGVSRAIAVVLAYLIQRNNISLKEACRYLRQRTNRIRPNRKLLEGLSDFEDYVLGHRATDIDSICF